MKTMPHVLVAEDEPATLFALGRLLDRCGCRVTLAHDGEEALSRSREDPPDVLLTDVRMPRLAGDALVAAIRRERPGLPVIVMTGEPRDAIEGALRAAGEGFLMILSKPVDVSRLVAVLNGLLVATA